MLDLVLSLITKGNIVKLFWAIIKKFIDEGIYEYVVEQVEEVVEKAIIQGANNLREEIEKKLGITISDEELEKIKTQKSELKRTLATKLLEKQGVSKADANLGIELAVQKIKLKK